MKIASRYPIKSHSQLLSVLVITHFIVLLLSFLTIDFSPFIVVVLGLICFSLYLTYRQHLLLTNATDDLCWSGENWLVINSQQNAAVCYLELKRTSWITSRFCLLKFALNQSEQAWLFSRASLGERTYRELCYLAKRDLSKTDKSEIDSAKL
ncbi:MAG: hypothetical protein KUG78_17615 [Kangiellaceae bacterium]|nr:hypothetical protein [Kangiellaceae bacterium]